MEQETNIALIIGLGSALLVFFGLIITIITLISRRRIEDKESNIALLKKQKQIELLTAISKAEEDQKLRLASLLHDEILPQINSAASNINGIVIDLERQAIADLEILKNQLKFLPILHESIREIIHEIVPKLFTSFGLIKAMQVYIRDMNKNDTSVVEFHNDSNFSGEPPFEVSDQLVIYKIFREILNNLQKHSHYSYLNISLEEVNKYFTVLFSHDGQGITNQEIKEFTKTSNGIGLKLLESRSLLLEAEINYTKDTEASYIRLKIPIKNE